MSATASVGAPAVQGGVMAPCTVTDEATGKTYQVSVWVSPQTWATIPQSQQSAYLQARALLAGGAGYPQDAQAIVQSLASGQAGPPETRNWAQHWMEGNVLS